MRCSAKPVQILRKTLEARPSSLSKPYSLMVAPLSCGGCQATVAECCEVDSVTGGAGWLGTEALVVPMPMSLHSEEPMIFSACTPPQLQQSVAVRHLASAWPHWPDPQRARERISGACRDCAVVPQASLVQDAG